MEPNPLLALVQTLHTEGLANDKAILDLVTKLTDYMLALHDRIKALEEHVHSFNYSDKVN